MKRSERLNAITDLYAQRERGALEALGASQAIWLSQQNQLEQLQTYRQEYLERFGIQQRAGINVSQLLELRAFSEKLEGAIEGQRRLVLQCERDVQRARKVWEECHQRTKSLKKVGEAALAEELKVELKQEQAEQDARAARSSRNNGTGSA